MNYTEKYPKPIEDTIIPGSAILRQPWCHQLPEYTQYSSNNRNKYLKSKFLNLFMNWYDYMSIITLAQSRAEHANYE